METSSKYIPNIVNTEYAVYSIRYISVGKKTNILKQDRNVDHTRLTKR